MRLRVLPLGPVPPSVLGRLSDSLAAYGIACAVEPERPVPQDARDPRRNMVNADAVLELAPRGGEDRLLAVTAEDLFAEGKEFVFGLALMEGATALVSIKRLADGDRRFHERLVKESVHELGHTFGLSHCERPGCVMNFSESVAEVDGKRRWFCPECTKAVPFAGGAR